MSEHSENKETGWLVKHGAKAILTIMIGGAVAYITNLTATVWSNEKRLDEIDPRVQKIDTVLRNQCQMLRHFKIGDQKECI
jgi:hypothetical protein